MLGTDGRTPADRFYSLRITCPENYPNVPPRIKFVTKINMPDVDSKTGEVSSKLLNNQWKPSSSMGLMLCLIRANMKAAGRLQQPPEGTEFS